MTTWELIFRQSKVNLGSYNGDRLPVQIWDWPRDTWFQRRLRHLRHSNTRSRALTHEAWQ
jgi:hypothetical protein